MENEDWRDKKESISDLKNYVDSSSHSASRAKPYPNQLKVSNSDAEFESLPFDPNNEIEHTDSSDGESEQSKKTGRLQKLY